MAAPARQVVELASRARDVALDRAAVRPGVRPRLRGAFGAAMILRPLEPAAPEAKPVARGGALVGDVAGAIAGIGDGGALCDHRAYHIGPVHRADRHQPAVGVTVLHRADHPLPRDQPDKPVARPGAAGPVAPRGIGAVLVKRHETIAGIFTERDYLQKIALASRASSETPVKDVMSSPVISAKPDDTVSQCLEVMTNCRCRHLPIVEDDKLLGIISIGDLVKSIVEEKQAEIDQLNQYISGSY